MHANFVTSIPLRFCGQLQQKKSGDGSRDADCARVGLAPTTLLNAEFRALLLERQGAPSAGRNVEVSPYL